MTAPMAPSSSSVPVRPSPTCTTPYIGCTSGGGHEQAGSISPCPAGERPGGTTVEICVSDPTPAATHHAAAHRTRVSSTHATIGTPPPHQLAHTGPDAAALAGIGGSAILIGAVLLAWGRGLLSARHRR